MDTQAILDTVSKQIEAGIGNEIDAIFSVAVNKTAEILSKRVNAAYYLTVEYYYKTYTPKIYKRHAGAFSYQYDGGTISTADGEGNNLFRPINVKFSVGKAHATFSAQFTANRLQYYQNGKGRNDIRGRVFDNFFNKWIRPHVDKTLYPQPCKIEILGETHEGTPQQIMTEVVTSDLQKWVDDILPKQFMTELRSNEKKYPYVYGLTQGGI